MTNICFHLFQLQKIDHQIDGVKKRLDEIARIRSNNRLLTEAELSFRRIEKEYIDEKTALSATEDKIAAKRIKIEQSESSLYGGKVSNPKELSDLQIEIESLKKNISVLEEIQLNQLLTLEMKEKELSEAQINISKITQNLETQNTSLTKEETILFEDQGRFINERKLIVEQVDPKYVDLYASLRSAKKGIAVTMIEDGCCSACGSTLTPSECQIAKSPNQIAMCPSCGRILYAG